MLIKKKIKNFNINFGPQHPAAHGVLRLIVELNGEIIQKADPHIGLLHRGTEKLLESKTYLQGLPYMDRLDYVSAMAQEYSFSMSIENLMSSKIPNRFSLIRILMMELTRLLNHLLSLTTHAIDVGALTPFLWAFEEREKLMQLYEIISGSRLHSNYIRPFGLQNDIPNGFLEKIFFFVKKFISRIDEMEDLLTNNRIWKQRLSNIGILKTEDVINLSFSGVMMRGSGIPWDLRKIINYDKVFNKAWFKLPIGEMGDSYDRYLVRIEEMRQTVNIIIQVLNLFDNTNYTINDHKIFRKNKDTIKDSMENLIDHFKYYTEWINITKGYSYCGIESPKGEFGIFIISDGSNTPYRCKIRAPGFTHLQGIDHMTRGHMIADLVTVIGTQDIVFGEVDR
jgi:NADH dehydrogenase (ubiquinone) Fe-S protein 2